MTPAEIIQDAAERYAQGYITDFRLVAEEVRAVVQAEAAAHIQALTDDRDSWREQASARVADAVQFAAERDAALKHAAEVRAVVLEEAAQCIDKLALRHKIDSKAWTALRGNAAAIRAMKGAV
jgi:hypothetical protein